ncbi:MAG TPA: DinB family protein [Candidatus Acidoferrum sp.]|nr:DinB family protein [Candidatus Acidoferrum sp.]
MAETAQQYIQRILSHVEGHDAIKVQRATAAKLKKATQGLTPKQLKWQPEPGKWSIAEIVAHLADVEIVASWRMRSVLGANGTPIQPFDQDAWASVFQYGKRDAKQSLEVFRVLRENNLAMLKALPRPSWENYGMHAERGKETVAHLARMFAGHDTNHLLQVERITAQLKSARQKKASRQKKKK